MNDLSNSILTYFQDNLQKLSPEKQFHFASRIYLWSRQPEMRSTLDKLRPWYTSADRPMEALKNVVNQSEEKPDYGSNNAYYLRRPFFDRYPKLTEYTPALLKVTYMKTIYDIDSRDEFFSLFPANEIDQFSEQLYADDQALAMLSSQAINFLYLYEQLIKENPSIVEPQRFLSIGQSAYDLTDKTNLQLMIYLYTHCIIGATQFYYHAATSPHAGIYNVMLNELDKIIEERFDDINLDNKFEFLVCAKIIGYQASTVSRILAEAEQSVSTSGQFLIDKHNSNPQSNNQSFERSEHRNVLFIMSNSDFHPLV
jgi:hypothetical protein